MSTTDPQDTQPTRRRNPRTSTVDQEIEEERRLAAAGTKGVSATPSAPPVKRTKLGWQVRVDLKRSCQQIALDTDKKDYEVLEMLLDEALAARAAAHQQQAAQAQMTQQQQAQ